MNPTVWNGLLTAGYVNDPKSFAVLTQVNQPAPEPVNENNVLKLLRSIKPDDLSPKQALEVLYKLKDLQTDKQKNKPEIIQIKLFG
jgi:hypothetical protein